MRRFEFVEGSSSKFWEPEQTGNVFTVTFGRIGTAGQRKEKAFADEASARREYEKKVAEKLREGYREVSGDGAPAAPPVPAGPPARPALPRRVPALTARPEQVAAAAAALIGLDKSLGRRSWRVTREALRARRTLRALGGVDPAAHAELSGPFASLMERVVATGRARLPVRHALALLSAVDVAAFVRTLDVWRRAATPVPGASVVVKQADALSEPELALRVGTLLVERPELRGNSEDRWGKRWTELRPHVEAHLTDAGGSFAAWLGALDTQGDAHVAKRRTRLEA
ncbi:molybdenum metabolism regulator [Corallococcus sp. H22C18031201]|nr:molybdenum metabolism regulator [Corallococcus sp. H22C18031201]